MNLNTLFILILMFMAGLALGALYFISLWETVRRLERTGGGAHLLAISFVVRLAIILIVFFFLMHGHWERLAAAMVGFVVIRKILTYHLGPQKAVKVSS
ncbi:MAG: ATP synthase subunit I [Smithella sp.]